MRTGSGGKAGERGLEGKRRELLLFWVFGAEDRNTPAVKDHHICNAMMLPLNRVLKADRKALDARVEAGKLSLCLFLRALHLTMAPWLLQVSS